MPPPEGDREQGCWAQKQHLCWLLHEMGAPSSSSEGLLVTALSVVSQVTWTGSPEAGSHTGTVLGAKGPSASNNQVVICSVKPVAPDVGHAVGSAWQPGQGSPARPLRVSLCVWGSQAT